MKVNLRTHFRVGKQSRQGQGQLSPVMNLSSKNISKVHFRQETVTLIFTFGNLEMDSVRTIRVHPNQGFPTRTEVTNFQIWVG